MKFGSLALIASFLAVAGLSFGIGRATVPEEYRGKVADSGALPADLPARITEIAKQVGSYNTELRGQAPAYDVRVTIGALGCEYVRNTTYDILRNLYSDPVAKQQISRVLVEAGEYGAASQGAVDGRNTSPNSWATADPDGLADVLGTFATAERQGVPLESQTWRDKRSC